MEEGLAYNMVYGSGSNNVAAHYYAGVLKNTHSKKKIKVPTAVKKQVALRKNRVY